MKSTAASGGPPSSAAGCDLGIVFAVPIEADAFERLATATVETRAVGFNLGEGTIGGRRVAWCVSGVGTNAASAATRLLVAGHRPQLVVSAGFAGGLDHALGRGSVVRPALSLSAVASTRFPLALAEPTVGPPLTIVTVDRVIASVAEKLLLARSSAAHLVDMETHAVATVAQAAGIPCGSVRVISDEAMQELPREVAALVAPQSSMRRLGAAVAAIGRRPRAALDMWRLYEHAVADGRTLAAALERLIESLPTKPSGS